MNPTNHPEPQPEPAELAGKARRITRMGLKAALATRDAQTGHPFISMAGAATAMDGAPVLLMSSLARHRQNLERHPHLSALFEAAEDRSNPLTGARVSLSGRIAPLEDAREQQRFLARQPKAFYAGFSDFAFFRLELVDAHYVGGFGIAATLSRSEYLLAPAQCAALRTAEAELLEMLNESRKSSVQALATGPLGAAPGAWRMTGVDPEGCDLMWKHRVLRFEFPEPVRSPEEVLRLIPGSA